MCMRMAAILALTLALAAPLRSAGPESEGAKMYKAKCAACHAADGSGDTAFGKKNNLRDLRSADVQKQSDSALAEITAKGKGKMPGYGKQLNEDAIRQIVSHIRELGKKR